MSIVVTTPTGNIGSVVVEELLAKGADVTVIARNPDKLTAAVREKASVVQGDHLDTDFVVKATEGADALFWLTPPNFTAPDWKVFFEQSAQAGAAAVTANRIPYVVHLSSAGADRATGFGPVSYLQIVENALAATGANVLQLRPGFFYENLLQMVDPIAGAGAVYYPVPGETRYPMIATHDIGVYAAARLLARDWSGAVIEGLHGPAEQPTFAEAAGILGEAVGKPVSYVAIPSEALREQFGQMGASPSVIDAYIELMNTWAHGAQPAEPRTPRTTTPTTLAQWASDVFRPAYEARIKAG